MDDYMQLYWVKPLLLQLSSKRFVMHHYSLTRRRLQCEWVLIYSHFLNLMTLNLTGKHHTFAHYFTKP